MCLLDPTGPAGERLQEDSLGREFRGLHHEESVGGPHGIGWPPARTVPPFSLRAVWPVSALPLAAIPHHRRPGWPAAERLEDRVKGSDLATSDDDEAVGQAHAGTLKQGSCPTRRARPSSTIFDRYRRALLAPALLPRLVRAHLAGTHWSKPGRSPGSRDPRPSAGCPCPDFLTRPSKPRDGPGYFVQCNQTECQIRRGEQAALPATREDVRPRNTDRGSGAGGTPRRRGAVMPQSFGVTRGSYFPVGG
jgi:hypothetical protein